LSTTKKLFIVAGVVGLVLIMGVGIFPLYRLFDPYSDRELSGPVTISSEWTEIIPKEPLKAERQIQYLTLDIADAFLPDYDLGKVKLSNGALVLPEVQLEDDKGTTYNLDRSGIDQKGMVFFMHELPKDKRYRVVRVRSATPIRCSRIYWRSYNQWDVS
jgi:hypothetical protein